MASDSAQQGNQDISTLSSTIERLIFKTRRLLRSTWVATGTAVAVGLFFATLAVVALFDLGASLVARISIGSLAVGRRANDRCDRYRRRPPAHCAA